MRRSSSPHSTHDGRRCLNIYALMKQIGIEPEAGVVPQFAVSYSAAVRRCRACDRKADCDAWLSEPREKARLVPTFCPSLDILSELQFGRLPRREALA